MNKLQIQQTVGQVFSGYLPFYLNKKSGKKLIITPSEKEAENLTKQLLSLGQKVCFVPAWDCLLYDRSSPSIEISSKRIKSIHYIRHAETVVISVKSLSQKSIPLDILEESSLHLESSFDITPITLARKLIEIGYSQVNTVAQVGEFSIRGDICDIFPVDTKSPVRIEFFDTQIDKLRFFDEQTQLSQDECSYLTLLPCREVVLNKDVITHFKLSFTEFFQHHDRMLNNPMYKSVSNKKYYMGLEHWLPCFYENPLNISVLCKDFDIYAYGDVLGTVEKQLTDAHSQYVERKDHAVANGYFPVSPEDLFLTKKEWADVLNKATYLSPLHNSVNIENIEEVPCFATERQTDKLYQSLKCFFDTHKNKIKIVTSSSSYGIERLQSLFKEHNITFSCDEEFIPKSPNIDLIYLRVLPIENGFINQELCILSDQDIFGARIYLPKKRQKKEGIALFQQGLSDLQKGELLVHTEHGVGRFEGLETLKVGKVSHDCLKLIYGDDAKLFVSVENLDVLSRYGKNSTTILDNLGSVSWKKRKAKMKKRLFDMAKKLMEVAAGRLLLKGEPVSGMPSDYEDFCARFPHTETDDQVNAIDDVLQDLTKGLPMDRLLCGDVGFGKTEVALRAAFVMARTGKQVAIIVPTTLLCRQHYHSFKERFEGFGLRVEQLSRLVTSRKSKTIKEDLKDGNVDIIIATHALFSRSVELKKLGLLIVDEEHHFGVKQKESIKERYKNVHLLSLSATPIPRTLQMSLTGIRDLSLITTPPVERQSVKTFVTPFDSLVVKEAILRELNRAGQVFYVCPRISHIAKISETLKKLLPDARIAVAHGQMKPIELEDVMTAFYERHYDILLSTQIIESGIDVPRANTLIVDHAELFGLAQLYQIRGRVGRASKQGYAYLTTPEKELTSSAFKRLESLQRLDYLGAGFKLASHDLEIRGSGNLVGEEQTGHIKEVGVDLYQNLLQEAILQAKGRDALPAEEFTPQLNLGVSVLIPESYIDNLSLRLDLYQRLAHIKEQTDIKAFAKELKDRFGKYPAEVTFLLQTMIIKILCKKMGIKKVDCGPMGVTLEFIVKPPIPTDILISYLQSEGSKKFGRSKIRPDQKISFHKQGVPIDKNAIFVRNLCNDFFAFWKNK